MRKDAHITQHWTESEEKAANVTYLLELITGWNTMSAL
jgi:hypothetical protein